MASARRDKPEVYNLTWLTISIKPLDYSIWLFQSYYVDKYFWELYQHGENRDISIGNISKNISGY